MVINVYYKKFISWELFSFMSINTIDNVKFIMKTKSVQVL